MSEEFKVKHAAVTPELAARFADELEVMIGQVMNGTRKADRLPVEHMIGLIQFSRCVAPSPASDADDSFASIEKFGMAKHEAGAATHFWGEFVRLSDVLAALTASTRTASDTRTAALEEAAKACEAEAVENTGHEGDRCYNMAIKDCTKAIRALAQAAGEAECDAALGRAAPASQHDSAAAGNPDGWLIDGGLLYQLGEDGANYHEINVTMTHGSRNKEACEAAAAGLLNIICASEASASPVEAKAGRKRAEYEYSISAFDYASNPIGSRDWTLFWSGYQAAARTQADAGKEREAAIDLLYRIRMNPENVASRATLLHKDVHEFLARIDAQRNPAKPENP